MLCTSASVVCGVSATPRRLDWRHEARGSGSECLASEHLVLYAMLKCVLRQRCQVQMCPLYQIELEFQRPTGVRVEDLLKKALFPLLKAAKQVAGRVKQDSEMSEVNM